LVEFVKIVGAKNAKALKCVVAASEGIGPNRLFLVEKTGQLDELVQECV
jgi:hypothetical protein